MNKHEQYTIRGRIQWKLYICATVFICIYKYIKCVCAHTHTNNTHRRTHTGTHTDTHGHTHGHTCAHTRTHTLTHSLTLTLTLSFILTWIFKSWRHNVPQYILHTLSMKEWLLTSVYIANHLDKHVFTFVFQYCLSEVFKWNIHTPATQSLKSVWATQYTKSVLRMIYSIKIMLRS